MTTTIQRNFSSGEISEVLHSRADTDLYRAGLKTCRNFVVGKQGILKSRSGTKHIVNTKTSGKKVKLIPFIFNTDQTYVLEFGHLYMRVLRNGEQVLDDDDDPYEIETSYRTQDLDDLRYVQSGDTITLTHKSYIPHRLVRTGHASWTLSKYDFVPSIERPYSIIKTNSSTGSDTVKYQVTAIDSETYEESLPGVHYNGWSSSGIEWPTSNTDVVYIYIDSLETVAQGTFKENDRIIVRVSISGVTKNFGGVVTSVTPSSGNITRIDIKRNEFLLPKKNVISYGYSVIYQSFLKIEDISNPSVSSPVSISWDAVDGALEYNVYREENGVFGFVGITRETKFKDIGVDIVATDSAPIERVPFGSENNFPHAGSYYQQRLIFANTDNNIELIEMSRVGKYENFTRSVPLKNDDNISLTLAGNQVNEVRHLVGMRNLLVLTGGGIWSLEGGANGGITPFDINAILHSSHGSSDTVPVIVGNRVIYEQQTGGIIRDISFDEAVNGYVGNDLSIYASHLIDDFSIVEIAYQESPDSIIWAVRSDGVLLGITYIPEQQILAWHRHELNGSVESITVVPEGKKRVLYLSVNRGGTRSIERLTERDVADSRNFVGMDSSVTYNGHNTRLLKIEIITSGAGTGVGAQVRVTGQAEGLLYAYSFSSDDVGKHIHLFSGDDRIVRLKITSVSSGVATTRALDDVGSLLTFDSLGDHYTRNWSLAIHEMSGLDHLDDKKVSISGDGFTIANPNNPKLEEVTVSDGEVSLGGHYDIVHVGLPITCDVETLDIEPGNSSTLINRKKNITQITVKVDKTVDFWVRTDGGPKSDSLEGFTQSKLRDRHNAFDSKMPVHSKNVSVIPKSQWSEGGRVMIRNSNPTPMTILGIAVEGTFKS